MRRFLERTERRGHTADATLPFRVEELDSCLPGGGLRIGHLREIAEGGAAATHAGLATLFSAGITARLPGPVFWCSAGRGDEAKGEGSGPDGREPKPDYPRNMYEPGLHNDTLKVRARNFR